MHCNLFLHSFDWFAKTWRVWKIWKDFFISYLTCCDKLRKMCFLMWHCWSLAQLGTGSVHSMCSHTARLTQGPAPGSAQFWEALRKVFSFRQVTTWQFAAAVCSSWPHRCGDEMHRSSFPMCFWPGEVLSPPGLLGLVCFNLSHVPSCGVLWLLHHGSSQDFFIFSCQLLHFFPIVVCA